MTRIIDWKGKIGYGDIISPICYAHNQADILRESVNLKFFFSHEKGTKFKEVDAETINDRIDYIARNTVPSQYGVDVSQIYKKSLSYNHTNYSDTPLSYHNLRFSKKPWDGSKQHIAVVSSLKNKKQFVEYAKGKKWKDPYSGKWNEYIELLSNTYDVKLIHYETPIEEAADIIRTSQIVIGYHGSAMWLARWLAAPMIIFSQKDISRLVFPWCVHNPTSDNILDAKEFSMYLLEFHKRELDIYVKSFYRV